MKLYVDKVVAEQIPGCNSFIAVIISMRFSNRLSGTPLLLLLLLLRVEGQGSF